MKSDISADSAAPGDFFADAPPPLRLIDSVRARIRVKHYSWRTEDTYVDWIKRYLRFHDKRHPVSFRWRMLSGFPVTWRASAGGRGCQAAKLFSINSSAARVKARMLATRSPLAVSSVSTRSIAPDTATQVCPAASP